MFSKTVDQKLKELESSRAKELQQEYSNAIIELINSNYGKIIIAKLFDRAGVWRTSMTGNSNTFFNEGKREIGLSLLEDIALSRPEAIAEIMLEHMNRVRFEKNLRDKWIKELTDDNN